MSNWNYSEDQLRKWTPRRPSPELRARVFGRQPLVHAAAQTFSDFSRWLVPAVGCFLLVVGGLSDRLSEARLLNGGTNFFAAESGGRTRIMLAEARQHSEKNAIPAKHMEYRLSADRLSQPDSPHPASYTNQLIHQ